MTDAREKRKVYSTRSKTHGDLMSQQLLDLPSQQFRYSSSIDPRSTEPESEHVEAEARTLRQKLREAETNKELWKLRVEELERRMELRELEMELNQLKAMVAVKQDFYNKREERQEELVCEWKKN